MSTGHHHTTPGTTHTPTLSMSNVSGISLVAGRELSTRLHSKAWQITTVVLAIIVIALAIVFKLISGSGGSTDTVGFTSQTQPLAAPLAQLGTATSQTFATRVVPSIEAGKTEVSNGDLDALVIPNPAGAPGAALFTVVVHKNLDATLRSTLNVLAGQVALDQQITHLGGDPAAVHAATAGATINVTPLQAPYPYQTQQLILGIVAGVLIYVSLMINGQSVAQGVVEEKTSRVVELLLSTLRPWQLMAGKVAGIGLVGLIQMLIIGLCGLATGLITHVLTISVTAAVGTVIWLVVWYLLGFFMYAIVFAALGALVSRQEEVSSSVTPALMFVVAGYVLGVSILPSNPGSPLIEVLSILPPFAPTMMPMRLAMGGVPVWEAGLSVVLVVALIPVLVWFAGRIYRNAVLRTGARVKLRQALRAA
jgi:ABC-2 type transport system permease protein